MIYIHTLRTEIIRYLCCILLFTLHSYHNTPHEFLSYLRRETRYLPLVCLPFPGLWGSHSSEDPCGPKTCERHLALDLGDLGSFMTVIIDHRLPTTHKLPSLDSGSWK